MKLVLVRHPEPEVAPGLCYGATDVPPRMDALAAVEQGLRHAGLPGDLPVFASPLERCARLATRLSAAVTFDARLSEMDFGAWEMRAWDAIPRADIEAWAADLLHYRPGGGEHLMDVTRRVADFLDELRQAGHLRVLLVCHAGTMRLLASLVAGGSLEQAALRAAATPNRIGYGAVLVLSA